MSHTGSDSDAVIEAMKKAGISPEDIISGGDVRARQTVDGSFAEREEKAKVEKPEESHEDDESEDDFSDQPSVQDQLERYPEHCIMSTPETSVFNLGEPDQLKAWNDLQALTIVPGTRQGNVVINSQINFHNGAYFVVANVRKVKYARLV